ncbi:MAG TPA: beta-ketoacyl-ACP synthase II [Planctomycetota bacterium]|nr:beta-ketoacyl-ACP synthase II [Planctomycetota bacterium]
MSRRRVVVTGLGAICGLGNDAPAVWAGAKAGRSSARALTRIDPTDLGSRIACEVRDFDADAILGHGARKLDPFCQYGVVAADEALKDSGLDPAREDLERCAVITGSGIGGLTELEAQHSVLMERGARRVSPFFIPRLMINALSGNISIRNGFRGPNYITASACASSSHAIGLAFRSLRDGECDVCMTGGAEATITRLAMAGFSNMKAMSVRNDDPERASRPFDRDRDGFVMGEGAGMLVLEELGRAKKRGARIYAEVKGFGMTADAHHITAPTPEGKGPADAMRLALRDGGVDPERVNYVNAHGTSTPLNDAAESRAIRTVFGGHADRLCVSSAKSMAGHLLGASGGLELVLTALMAHEGVVHPTINYENPDPECDLDYVPNEARPLRIDHALSNSLGFGGHNVSILVARFDG